MSKALVKIEAEKPEELLLVQRPDNTFTTYTGVAEFESTCTLMAPKGYKKHAIMFKSYHKEHGAWVCDQGEYAMQAWAMGTDCVRLDITGDSENSALVLFSIVANEPAEPPLPPIFYESAVSYPADSI